MKEHLLYLLPVPVLLLCAWSFDQEVVLESVKGSTQSSLFRLALWYSALLLFSSAGHYLLRTIKLNRFLTLLQRFGIWAGGIYFTVYALGTSPLSPSKSIALTALLIGLGMTAYLMNLTIGIINTLLERRT